ncbi:MAG: ACP S-malonyltransferase [Firmicutes bacterium]|nr:ACP S-malonyltransferase [Bacillota bacterium]
MKTVMIFPGVGTQYPALVEDFRDVLNEYPKMAGEFSEVLGISWVNLLDHLKEWGRRPRYGTVIGIIYGIMVGSYWIERFGRPDTFTGLSNGMYVACALSGALSPLDAVTLCYQRGLLIEDLSTSRDMMTGIIEGITISQLEAVVADVRPYGLVEITGHNTLTQFVVGGTVDGVRRVLELAVARHASLVLELDLPVAFHSSHMRDVNRRYVHEVLSKYTISASRVPIISSINGEILTNSSLLRDHLASLLETPVRFVEVVNRCRNLGITEWVVGGPGRTVAGLLSTTDHVTLATRLSEVSRP